MWTGIGLTILGGLGLCYGALVYVSGPSGERGDPHFLDEQGGTRIMLMSVGVLGVGVPFTVYGAWKVEPLATQGGGGARVRLAF